MNKTYIVNIKVKVKSIDSVPGLLYELSETMKHENDKGMLEKEDGDRIEWVTR